MKLTIPAPIRPAMKDYGIQQSSDGLLSWVWVLEQLEKSKNYWVSTTRTNGNPHAAPIWGVLMDDTVYWGTGDTSLKNRNLLANPNIVLHTESGFDVVIVEGIVEKVTERATFERIAPIYSAKYEAHNYTPTADELASGLMYCVKPHTVMAWKETDFPNTATKWIFL